MKTSSNRNISTATSLAFFISVGTLLSSCGQKGPLYTKEAQNDELPQVEYVFDEEAPSAIKAEKQSLEK